MPSWVNAEPELARPDYTHFSPRGAKLVASMFYNALILEYNNYLKEEKE
jgi:lysophospholipase L1-like esterase